MLFRTAAISAALVLSSALAADAAPLVVHLAAQNHSGETGTAVLSPVRGGVKVVVTMKRAPKTAQPEHIHVGTCAHLNPVPRYPLANLINGMATTVVKNVTLAQLQKGTFAINVHKSTTNLATYVACGNIPKT